jgi:4-hydroxythreonine-4-phosphate dehydrogenase
VIFAITLGDVTGIGPEIVARALSTVLGDDDTRYVVFGDREHWAKTLARYAPGLDIEDLREGEVPRARVSFTDAGISLPADLVPADPRAGQAALAWLAAASKSCVSGAWAGMITAPLCKEAVIRAGNTGFRGQTEFLATLTGTRDFAMMLLGHDDRDRWLRVALVTTHLPLSKVPEAITPEAVLRAVELADQACRRLGLTRRRIGVCGLNPHAGEGGWLGREEIEVIAPSIGQAQEKGVDASGPYAADTLFHRALSGDYDAVVAQYHDQGLGPLKLVAFDNGVNWTLGLPYLRMSPDHGTAHDIAGRGIARASSMITAIRLARRIASNATDHSAMQ